MLRHAQEAGEQVVFCFSRRPPSGGIRGGADSISDTHIQHE